MELFLSLRSGFKTSSRISRDIIALDTVMTVAGDFLHLFPNSPANPLDRMQSTDKMRPYLPVQGKTAFDSYSGKTALQSFWCSSCSYLSCHKLSHCIPCSGAATYMAIAKAIAIDLGTTDLLGAVVEDRQTTVLPLVSSISASSSAISRCSK